MSLTEKQRRFVEEYCLDGNATQAALRAGYAAPGAAVQGHDNLRKPKIAAAIAERQKEHAQRCDVTVESLTKELDEAMALAQKEGQAGAYVQAVMGKAKLHGLITDKKQHAITGGLADLLREANGHSGTFDEWRGSFGRSEMAAGKPLHHNGQDRE